ncbi:MAG: hypothetical protein DRG39_07515 [Deltaproteobacteria bacterium]|nr:MAG: hypothetical protein DRG39_07515 [Deltaproteobacteria bacterium]
MIIRILKELRDVFWRRHFFQYDYFCTTNTLSECWLVVKALLKREPLKDGRYIRLYEKEAAKVMGCKYGYSFATGRQALYAILKALGIGEGDEVLIQAFTCVVVPRAVMYAGAIPVYVDIDRKSFNMDSEQIRQHIGSRTKAIIVQHTFGRAAEIGYIQEIADYYGLFLIEDCCHAVGCKWHGKPLGSFGDASFYSSDHTKMISTSTGGVAFTNSERVAKRIEENRGSYLSNFTILRILFTFIVETIITHPRLYWCLKLLRECLNRTKILYFFRDENSEERPRNYPARFSNIQALIGLSQLRGLEDNLAKRAKCSGEGVPLLRKALVVESEEARDLLIKNDKYFVAGCWYNSPVFGCEDLSSVKYKVGSCPVAEEVSAKVVNLPTHHTIR